MSVKDTNGPNNSIKIEDLNFLRKSSETYFFEIFNKLKKKCPILIPDTIFVSGNTISSWYFTSKKNRAILKKKPSKLNPLQVFKTLYRQSVISVEEDFDDVKINEYLKKNANQEDDYPQQMKIDSPDIQRRNSMEIDFGLTQNQWTLKRVIKEMQSRSMNNNSIFKHDEDMPYIAYVKFHSQRSRPYKPFEFFQLLHEHLGEIKMIQTFIYTRGFIEDDYKNQQQNKQRRDKQIKQQSGSYLCEFSHVTQAQQPQCLIFKKQISSQLQDQLHKQKIRSLNQLLNSQIEEKTRYIVSYIQNTTKIDVKKMWLKFIEDVSGEVFFNGIIYDIYYLQRGVDSLNSNQQNLNDSEIFSGNKIITDKHHWRSASILPVCYGEFCDYQFLDQHKFLSYRGKKKEFEKNFSLIPNQNKIFNVQQSKKDLLIEDEDVSLSPKRQYSKNEKQDDDDLGLGIGNTKSQQQRYQRKKLYPDSFNTLYKSVSVCKSCYLIYSLLSEYFDELITVATSKQDSNSKNWVHTEKMLHKKDEKPVTFVLKKGNNGVGLTQAASPNKNGDNFETKKQFLQKNLSTVNIANLKGQSLFSGTSTPALISLQCQSRAEVPLPKKRHRYTMTQTAFTQSTAILPSTTGLMPSVQLFQPETNSTLSGNSQATPTKTKFINNFKGPSSVTKLTESAQIRIPEKISFKFVNNLEREQRRDIKAIIMKSETKKSVMDVRRGSIRKDNKGSPLGINQQSTIHRNSKTRLISMKQSLGLAMNNLFKTYETKYYLSKSQSEVKKMVNFFTEVSKDPVKFSINIHNSHHQNQSLEIQAKQKVLFPDFSSRNSVLATYQENNTSPLKNIFGTNDTQNKSETVFQHSDSNNNNENQNLSLRLGQLSKMGSSDSTPKQGQGLLNKLLVGTIAQNPQSSANNIQVESLQNNSNQAGDPIKKTALTNINLGEQQRNFLSGGNQSFQNNLHKAIIRMASRMINEQMEILREATNNNETSRSGLGGSVQNSARRSENISKQNTQHLQLQIVQKRTLRVSMANQVIHKKRRNPNITSSMFHNQNLSHIKGVPFYRISTPKAPFYSSDILSGDGGGPDDKYIIPIENYKTMNIDQYAELMKIDKEKLQDCGVFFINEHTSMLYCIIENSHDQSSSHNLGRKTQVDDLVNLQGQTDSQIAQQLNVSQNSSLMSLIRLHQQNTNQKKKVFHNYIVIMDIFDSFLDKMEIFEKLSKESVQPVRFIMLNLPGQAYTQYNFKNNTTLNNQFQANCIDLLLFHLHEKNLISCLFEPYSFIGFGNGANIALYMSMLVNDTNENLRSVLLFNGFSYVDQMMKDTLSTAIDNLQKCPPEMLKDYGDYYIKSLILSSNNLNKKINEEQNNMTMLTQRIQDDNNSVQNGNEEENEIKRKKIIQRQIEIKDKINLCKGVMANISIKEKLKYLKTPIIQVYSKRNCFVNLKHCDTIKSVSFISQFRQSIPTSDQKASTNFYEHLDQIETNKLFNPIEQILNENIKRNVFLIDGAHDVFSENRDAVEKILLDLINVKAPMKYFLMSSLKQSFARRSMSLQLQTVLNQ